MITDEQLDRWLEMAREVPTKATSATAYREHHLADVAVPALVEEVRRLRGAQSQCRVCGHPRAVHGPAGLRCLQYVGEGVTCPCTEYTPAREAQDAA